MRSGRREGAPGVYQADVRDSPAVREIVRRVEADLGGIEGLVNNAGTLTRRTTQDTTREDWDSVLSTCLTGPFICVQAVLPGMIARNRGAIVNVASIAGLTGGVMGPHYAAAKGGLVNMTRYLARDLAVHYIRVNAVAPTLTETDMVKEILAEGARPCRCKASIRSAHTAYGGRRCCRLPAHRPHEPRLGRVHPHHRRELILNTPKPSRRFGQPAS
jgi:NAD(P)-dependent dehydrogenase (short-subunit alcohol dehydrogenase family)